MTAQDAGRSCWGNGGDKIPSRAAKRRNLHRQRYFFAFVLPACHSEMKCSLFCASCGSDTARSSTCVKKHISWSLIALRQPVSAHLKWQKMRLKPCWPPIAPYFKIKVSKSCFLSAVRTRIAGRAPCWSRRRCRPRELSIVRCYPPMPSNLIKRKAGRHRYLYFILQHSKKMSKEHVSVWKQERHFIPNSDRTTNLIWSNPALCAAGEGWQAPGSVVEYLMRRTHVLRSSTQLCKRPHSSYCQPTLTPGFLSCALRHQRDLKRTQLRRHIIWTRLLQQFDLSHINISPVCSLNIIIRNRSVSSLTEPVG